MNKKLILNFIESLKNEDIDTFTKSDNNFYLGVDTDVLTFDYVDIDYYGDRKLLRVKGVDINDLTDIEISKLTLTLELKFEERIQRIENAMTEYINKDRIIPELTPNIINGDND